MRLTCFPEGLASRSQTVAVPPSPQLLRPTFLSGICSSFWKMAFVFMGYSLRATCTSRRPSAATQRSGPVPRTRALGAIQCYEDEKRGKIVTKKQEVSSRLDRGEKVTF